MSIAYDLYLVEHRDNVKKAYEWLAKYLPHLVEGSECLLENPNYIHDYSKDKDNEYDAYDHYFYGVDEDEEEELSEHRIQCDFDRAWMLHIHRNPHHWQYWTVFNDNQDEGYTCVEMPMQHMIEMICDWWSFSFKKGDLYEIFNWYRDRKHHIRLHEWTRYLLEHVLEEIREELDRQYEVSKNA